MFFQYAHDTLIFLMGFAAYRFFSSLRAFALSWRARKPEGVVVEDLRPQIQSLQNSITHPKNGTQRELELQLASLKSAIEQNHRLTQTAFEDAKKDLVRAVVYASVVASRSERRRLSPDELLRYRLGWWVTSNNLSDMILNHHPLDDMPKPPPIKG